MSIYAVPWGHCNKKLKAQMMGNEDFDKKKREKDCTWLFKHIKGACLDFEHDKETFMSLYDASLKIERKRQGNEKSTVVFFKEFKNLEESYKDHEGTIGNHKFLITIAAKNNRASEPGGDPSQLLGNLNKEISMQTKEISGLSSKIQNLVKSEVDKNSVSVPIQVMKEIAKIMISTQKGLRKMTQNSLGYLRIQKEEARFQYGK